ncbi:MAG: proton-conducting transporter transmembrane domain-containing protein [Dissulfurimicrobium sp.]|uniref:proton-conducting transporter transmembrane domain-containing protein n=1 Tax=Dissulfurimicrobium sp. TaxID=2022436 RepID=UPI00404B47A1
MWLKGRCLSLHIWLPHAHPAAPSHVSALMSGMMIKMGIYGILRLYLTMSPNSIVIKRNHPHLQNCLRDTRRLVCNGTTQSETAAGLS